MKQFLINYTYGLFFTKGRIGRLRYFLSVLFFIAWSLFIYFIIIILLGEIFIDFYIHVMIGYLILNFLGLIIIKIRRLHDLNMSGWWSILFTLIEFIPVIGLITLYLLLKKGSE